MPTQIDPFSRGRISNDGIMRVNGLTCVLNMPLALKQRFENGVEVAQGLPPYNVRTAFNVEDYEACPDTWMRGGPEAASYFVPVDPFLEQYRHNCPKHAKPFGADRFCEECGYKWNPQNYLAGNATPQVFFWLDGFWAEDGVTRQYILTEEELRGIASQVIGEKAVFAIGIAFFPSKEPKPRPVYPEGVRFRGGTYHFTGSKAKYGHHGVLKGLDYLDGPSVHHVIGGYDDDEPVAMASLMSVGEETTLEAVIEEKTLHVGAGAKISQEVYPDPEELSFWQEKPAGRIYINYVGVETAKAILSKGKRDRTAGGEGWMNGLKVGNPAE